MKDIALSVENLSKDFKLPHERKSTLKEWLLHFNKPSYEKLHALRGVSFEVQRGEFFGIVGRNGSGKSTLLKLIGGIYQPTAGSIQVNGTLTPFIELGIGFNPELTGRENVYLNGAILGLTKKEIEKKYDQIVAFSELHRFMDQKLKNYSSGMQVRLAFSIAIQAHNDILLIDEVLAVGDAAFQEKCFNEFNKIKASGKTVIFISHDLGSVEKFCDRVMIINDSRVVDTGQPSEMVLKYSNLIAEAQVQGSPEHTNVGTGKIQIVNTELIVGSKSQTYMSEGVAFTLRTHFKLKDDALAKSGDLMFGVSVTTENNISLIAPNTGETSFSLTDLPVSGYIDAHFPANPLSTGRYQVVAGFFNLKGSITHDYATNLLSFKINGKARHGITNLEPVWTVKAEA